MHFRDRLVAGCSRLCRRWCWGAGGGLGCRMYGGRRIFGTFWNDLWMDGGKVRSGGELIILLAYCRVIEL